MNSTQLAEKLASVHGLTKVKSKQVLASIFGTIGAEVKRGRKVAVAGFGTFNQGVRRARKGRNPATGAAISIPRTKYPKFSASAPLKRLVKGLKA